MSMLMIIETTIMSLTTTSTSVGTIVAFIKDTFYYLLN
jgi:hypothetical protein